MKLFSFEINNLIQHEYRLLTAKKLPHIFKTPPQNVHVLTLIPHLVRFYKSLDRFFSSHGSIICEAARMIQSGRGGECGWRGGVFDADSTGVMRARCGLTD